MTGSSPSSRPPRSRPPISIALIGLVTLLTAGTGATLGALAWREKLAGSRALVDNALQQTVRMTADHNRLRKTVARLSRGTLTLQ